MNPQTVLVSEFIENSFNIGNIVFDIEKKNVSGIANIMFAVLLSVQPAAANALRCQIQLFSVRRQNINKREKKTA